MPKYISVTAIVIHYDARSASMRITHVAGKELPQAKTIQLSLGAFQMEGDQVAAIHPSILEKEGIYV